MTDTAQTDVTTTSIVMVLDRSGSMESCRDATIKSVNGYLKEAKGDANLKAADFELMIFDSQSIDTIRTGKIAEIADISRADFQPRGGTPLLDAVGRGVDALDKKAADGKAILVVVTDGEENSSRKHNYESIKALIENRQDKGWMIVFLGAGLSSAQQGMRMGVAANNVANIGMDEQSMAATMDFMSASSVAYSATRSMGEAKLYARSEKLSKGMRMAMGDASGGAGIVDDPLASHPLSSMPHQTPPLSRGKLVKPKPADPQDAWSDNSLDSWGA